MLPFAVINNLGTRGELGHTWALARCSATPGQLQLPAWTPPIRRQAATLTENAMQYIEQLQVQAGHKFDLLLSSAGNEEAEAAYQRLQAPYLCKDERYRVLQRKYERQYAQLYFTRLSLMSGVVRERAVAKWPGIRTAKILEVGDLQEGTEVVAIGTLFKGMKLKPSIMDEYTKDRGVKAALGASSFCSDDDFLILEDEGGRMLIKGDCLPVQELVTGIVVAVKGYAEVAGNFVVQDLCYMGLPPQRPLSPSPSQEDKYVALVSGLGLGRSNVDLLKVQMAVDFLTGSLGSDCEQQLASRVVRLVIAGGTVGTLEQLAATTAHTRQQSTALQPVRDMDLVLTELAAALPVDLMPGAEDPSNVALPQQPLHRCLFPAAASYGSFCRVTNPHDFEVEGVHFLGTSGQNIDDIAKYSRITDRLSMMECCLTWRHMAPTAPDTLTCYPYHDQDPFILESAPHVFFVGNQAELRVGSVQGSDGQSVRLISVPSFHRSPVIVLVNLRTLDCKPISFQGCAMDE